MLGHNTTHVNNKYQFSCNLVRTAVYCTYWEGQEARVGQLGDGERKSQNTLHLKLSLDLEEKAKRAWKSGYMRDIAFKEFVLAMVRLGVECFELEGGGIAERVADVGKRQAQ